MSATGADLVLPVDWRGLPGVDLLGAAVTVPAGVAEARTSRPTTCASSRAGRQWAPSCDDAVIPAEAGQWLIDSSVSFTKGCFTGQELVARIDSRGGNVPRHLRGVIVTDQRDPDPSAPRSSLDGEVRGTLTSVGESLDLRAPVALAYVHRSVGRPRRRSPVRWDAPATSPVPPGESSDLAAGSQARHESRRDGWTHDRGAAGPGGRLGTDLAAHGHHQLAHDGQAQARLPASARRGSAGT